MFSTVRLNGEIGRAYCMFCGNSDSTWYTITGEITAKDYKILMDSGWRRCGTIIRKPNRLKTCCPTYALYCGAENFRLSKSQKKVLRGFNNYLNGKGKFKDATKASARSTCCEDQSVGANNLASSPQVFKSGASGDAKMSANGVARNTGAKRKSGGVKKGSVANSCCKICPTDVNNHQTIPQDVMPKVCQDTGRSADKRVNLSARKKFKHATETSVTADCVGNGSNHVTNHTTNPKVVKRQVSKDSGFVDDKNSVNTGRPVSARSKRWQALQDRMLKRAEETGVSYETILKEYQIRRQKRLDKNKPKDLEDYLRSEPREGEAAHFLDIRLYKCSPRSAEFEATLDEEFKLYSAYQIAVHKEAPEDLTRDGFIEEIAFIRDLHRTFGSRVAAYADPMQYTLGSYVHSCAKMQYKTHFSPSYLICPETYTMVSVEKCQRLLDENEFSRFAEADVEKASCIDRYNTVLLLPYSPHLTSLLPKSQFTVEGNVIITTVAAAARELSEHDSQKVKDWLNLVRSPGTMRIDCCHQQSPTLPIPN
ncbi:unnamed protein product [Taenia asiatica]|uniref:Arginyl-tRNA--protein transferase 1 n=2 Tax=Taenia asiatica TaxID=60517 RepID=A0A0R3W4P1_TAEAS|nr:unnamed protein product [Taenia asiatica]